MKPKLAWASLLIVLLLLSSGGLVSAQRFAVGVSKGDSFVYEMSAQYVSSVSNETVEVPAFEANNTDWVRIDITGVNGSLLSQLYTLRYKNGTDQIFSGQTDLSNGSSYMQESGGFRGVPFCPPNLSAGDSLQTLQLTINETVIWQFLGGSREVNHVYWTSSLEVGDVYFDRQTGVLLDLYRQHAFTNEVTGEVVKKADIIKMKSSSLWVIPEFPDALLATVLVLSAASCGALVFKVKRHSGVPFKAHS
jgi:hypothetical protein